MPSLALFFIVIFKCLIIFIYFFFKKIEPEVKPVLFDCILFINTMFPVAVFIYGCLVSIMLTEGPFGTVVKSINFVEADFF